IESAEPYLSPRAQDASYAAQQHHILGSDAGPSPGFVQSRLHPTSSGLKLITDFSRGKSMADERTPMGGMGVTPIMDSAMTPATLRPGNKFFDPVSAKTATPGGFASRNRYPSKSSMEREPGSDATPLPRTAISRGNSESELSQRSRSASTSSFKKSTLATLSPVAYQPSEAKSSTSHFRNKSASSNSQALPSPAPGVFTALSSEHRTRNGSRTRKPDGLELQVEEVTFITVGPETASTGTYPTHVTDASSVSQLREGDLSPQVLTTDGSMKSAKIRSIDRYISSLEEANFYARQQRVENRQRTQSHEAPRVQPQTQPQPPQQPQREASEVRGRVGTRYIKPAKRSPSSPVSMSPDDPALNSNNESFDDERYYKITSPTESQPGGRGRSQSN
ncbi:hypothetical protein LTS18_011545, partial [Coniosporium uncinatum]